MKVLFVCMGNICRSPTAEGIFREKLREAGLTDRILIDSAGTHGYHVGNPPDRRAMQAAASRNVDISDLRARQFESDDFYEFDLILVMDQDNHADVMSLCPAGMEERVAYFLSYAPDLPTRNVPDPYYGGADGFEKVLDMVEAASEGLLDSLRATM